MQGVESTGRAVAGGELDGSSECELDGSSEREDIALTFKKLEELCVQLSGQLGSLLLLIGEQLIVLPRAMRGLVAIARKACEGADSPAKERLGVSWQRRHAGLSRGQLCEAWMG